MIPGGPEERRWGPGVSETEDAQNRRGRVEKEGQEKWHHGSRTSQQRVELLFNYIFTNPGAHLNCLRLNTVMLSFSHFFSFSSLVHLQ